MNRKAQLLVKRLCETAKVPTKGSIGAAGYDLYSSENSVVPARGKAVVKTGIAIVVPTGNYGRVAPRSGLAVKNFIDTGAGVIDEDYRGEVGVVLFNHSEKDFDVKIGDRVAQLIIEKITDTEIVETDELDETLRGAGGFGSTGVREIIQSELKPVKRNATEAGLPDNLLKSELHENGENEDELVFLSIARLQSLYESNKISLDDKKRLGNLILESRDKSLALKIESASNGSLAVEELVALGH